MRSTGHTTRIPTTPSAPPPATPLGSNRAKLAKAPPADPTTRQKLAGPAPREATLREQLQRS